MPKHFIILLLQLAVFFPSQLHAKKELQLGDVYEKMRVSPKLTISSTSELVRLGKLCQNNRIALAPNGLSAALWRGADRYVYSARKLKTTFPNQVYVASLSGDKTTILSSSLILDPIAWKPDSEAFQVSIAGELIAYMKTGSEQFIGFEAPAEAFRFARLNADRLISADELLSQYQQLAVFSNNKISEDDRHFVFFGKEALAIRFSHEKRTVTFSDKTKFRGDPNSLFALRDLRVLKKHGKVELIGFGVNAHSLDASEPYLSSVFDRLTGERTALFGPKAIFQVGDGKAVRVFEATSREVILDVDQIGNRYAILLDNLDHSQRILYGPLNNLGEFQNCTGEINFAPPISQPKTYFGSVGVGKHKISIGRTKHDLAYVLLRSTESKLEKLTIIIHGGPLASAITPLIHIDQQTNLARCGDVLMVDGTGTVGGGQHNSSNAARKGVEAFKHDALALRDLASNLGYKSVDVIGNSFGGLTGVAISQIDWPALRSIGLVAPALQLLPPDSEPLERKGLFKTSKVSRKGLYSFEKYVFGRKRQIINRAMDNFLANPDRRVHIYLGTDDQQVPISLMPKNFPKDQLTVIEEADHNSIFRHQKVLSSLEKTICG